MSLCRGVGFTEFLPQAGSPASADMTLVCYSIKNNGKSGKNSLVLPGDCRIIERMVRFLKIFTALQLATALPVSFSAEVNCSANKRGEQVDGKYAQLQRCIKEGNCSSLRRSPAPRGKVKKPRGTHKGSR